MKLTFLIFFPGFYSLVQAAACPFGELRRSGLLSAEDIEKFDAVKRNPAAAEAYLNKYRREDPSEKEKRQGLLGPIVNGILELPLGGGLLNGILQPLTGVLSELDIPSPQPQGLAVIPGNDPDHQFQTPRPTDFRGLCLTFNALANHGYISRDGITTFAEAANAVQTGYGGDLVSGKCGIGGADSRVPNTLRPALGLDKHGVFEIDVTYVATADKYGGDFGSSIQAEDNFAVSHAARIFVYEGLSNGTTPGIANYANRRGSPLSILSAFEEAAALFLQNPRELGGNEGLNNFVPLDIDLGSQTPAQIGCFILENMLDLAPGQIQPTVVNNLDVYTAFVKGIIAPFFVNDGYFNCDVTDFVEPSASAGVNSSGSKSSSGSPVNGAYPGVGVIQPDSQPS